MLLILGPSSNRVVTGEGDTEAGRHLLFGFQLRQVQVPVLIAYNPLVVLLQLLLGLCIQTSLHELDKPHKRHRMVKYNRTVGGWSTTGETRVASILRCCTFSANHIPINVAATLCSESTISISLWELMLTLPLEQGYFMSITYLHAQEVFGEFNIIRHCCLKKNR